MIRPSSFLPTGSNPHEDAEKALDEAHDEATGRWRPKWVLSQVNGASGNFVESLGLGFGITLRIEQVVDEERNPNYIRAKIDSMEPTFAAGTSRAKIMMAILTKIETMARMLAEAIDLEDAT